MFKKFPMELVPRHWGGSREGNDEYCSDSDIWMLGALGPKYFSKEDQIGFVKVTVNARDKLHLNVPVKEVNATLEWKFRTDDNDINFMVSHEAAGPIVPLKRVESHKILQDGQHRCNILGNYKFVFDNTFSYCRAKTLYYKIDVVAEETFAQNVA